MSWKPEDDQEDYSSLVPWKGRQSPPENDDAPYEEIEKIEQGFFATLRKLYRAIRGNTATDVSRLKEATIQQVEGPGRLQLAQAEAKIAEAAKLHAEAEKAHAEAQKIKAEGQSALIDAETRSMTAKAEAVDRVLRAISKIRQEGGDVAFDEAELRTMLSMRESTETGQTKEKD